MKLPGALESPGVIAERCSTMGKEKHGGSNSATGSGSPPRAIHRSTIFGGAVDVYLLDDGQELISKRGVMRGLAGRRTDNGGAKDGKLDRLLARLPDEYADLRAGAKVAFIMPEGGLAEGISPLSFADILGAYADLFLAGRLRENQEHLGRNAIAILRAASKLGLSELVSEALGTTCPAEQRHRERLFHDLLRSDAGVWDLAFDVTLVRALAPLYGITYMNGPYPKGLHMPFGMIYEMIFGVEVAVELRKRNERPETYNHHQYLRPRGGSTLRNELEIVELLARQSRTKGEFWGRMRSHYLGEPLQLGFA
jgi:hypothetical protein